MRPRLLAVALLGGAATFYFEGDVGVLLYLTGLTVGVTAGIHLWPDGPLGVDRGD